MLCINTILIDQQAAKEGAEIIEDALLAAHEKEVLKDGGECHPLSPSNIEEALAMQDMVFYNTISQVLKSKSYDLAGAMLELVSKRYWEKKAEEFALKAREADKKRNEEDRMLFNYESRN